MSQTSLDLTQPKARGGDPATSHQAAEEVRLSLRAGSARWKLMQAHARHALHGLTDEEAARDAGLSLTSEYATRCSELTKAGYLGICRKDGKDVERVGASGQSRVVRALTAKGVAWCMGNP